MYLYDIVLFENNELRAEKWRLKAEKEKLEQQVNYLVIVQYIYK